MSTFDDFMIAEAVQKNAEIDELRRAIVNAVRLMDQGLYPSAYDALRNVIAKARQR